MEYGLTKMVFSDIGYGNLDQNYFKFSPDADEWMAPFPVGFARLSSFELD